MTNRSKFIGYVGTYTKGESKGIYCFTLDSTEEKIKDIKVAAELENPTYLNLSKDNRYLYSVAKQGDAGGVAAFSLDDSTGELKAINSQMQAGSPPCHVSVDSENRYVFSANYHKGSVESHLIDQKDGSVEPAVSVIKHEGSGPDPRQEKPHTHFAGVTPNEKYVAVVELGTDSLITYEVNEEGKLKEVSRLATHPGSGPRHLAFHPNHKFAYIMTEFSSEVIVLTYDAQDGHFTEQQYISTLPADFKENNQGSAIHISADGRFVYAGNRGHNSIAVFRVNQETGELTFVEHTSTQGDWPRDFSLDPTEKFIVASNQESSSLVLYARDEHSGKLTLLQSDIKVPHPVCVKFLNA
ncbi:lactonase family protein [Aneurinibacillus sp. Ricciae_BoGa-3]|uniref:lactonase family protein n=1 Tax=Aneurinibacillus sp. Ricciae_BoGa-3 TaxID=3022697 RepID=UPI0023426503|nr:lactonase family protein [Aneurinibacillus sp. Ricciae_BoGa-3]WCK56712.1 lactonase family protein [Aneurinibacillus sp. Ricciae_BoGa-3]